jgi:hypothetical protein
VHQTFKSFAYFATNKQFVQSQKRKHSTKDVIWQVHAEPSPNTTQNFRPDFVLLNVCLWSVEWFERVSWNGLALDYKELSTQQQINIA